jgi:PAS domain S-box-containing protein
VFAIACFVLFAWLLYYQQQKQVHTRNWIYHTNRAISKIDSFRTLIAESETATRNYLLTDEPERISELRVTHKNLDSLIAALKILTNDNPLQKQNLKKLDSFLVLKEAFQNRMVQDLEDKENKLERLKLNGEGPVLTRQLHAVLNEMSAKEKILLASRTLENANTNQTSSSLIIFIGVFSITLVLVIIFRLNADNVLRKKAEQGLLISEEKYRNLIENAGAVMYTTDQIGNISFANSRVTDLTGFTVEELLGKHFSILLEPKRVQEIVSFYVKQFSSNIQATILEFPIRTKQGEEKWVEQSAQLLTDENRITGFQCMVKDISEKKKVEEELNRSEVKRKENEYQLNAIMDNSIALIYIKDMDGRYLMANTKFKQTFGLTDEMVIGLTDYDFNPKEKADHYKQLDEEIIKSLQPQETEEQIETPWGTRSLLSLKFPLITPDGKLLGISCIATDITDKIELQKQLIRSLEKAESAQQIQEQFLANMSHEIRTPMNGIQGMTRLLLETKLTDDQRKFTNMINRSLNNLVVIVTNVLDFSNLKTGKLTLDSSVFDFYELLEEGKKQIERDLTSKNLAFRLTIDPNVPRFVKSDARRVRQILSNLVGNAVKFTNSGEIALHVSVISQTAEQADIHFLLTDTGIGIAANKLETIFESFAQAEKKISSGYGGAGLGLTISKGLIELLGGTISVKSNPGKGSEFSFHILFELTGKQENIAQQTDYSLQLKGKKILVVEDNMVNQMLISFVLKKVHIVPDMAANGKEAINLCEKNHYDLIIMDLQMPEMDGYETTIYLREEMKLTTPIIAMTATALLEDQERSARVGMNDFMIKPFDFTDLYTRLVRLLFTDGAEAAPVELSTEMEIAETETEEPLYDLSLLEELDDKNALLDVLMLFFESTPDDMKTLELLAKEDRIPELYKMAHKLKSAVAMIQSLQLRDLLKTIETNAKEEKNIPETKQMVKQAVELFYKVEKSLRKKMESIRKELDHGA